ncbi:MAG TPA: class I SAM-dependent methyltransferase [Anaerolineales bacterium]|nr:class I SAM-dependent methyltransferase [Anaerolineales bacterium]
MATPPSRGYQTAFYDQHEGVRDLEGRKRKARKIAAVLREHAGFALDTATCLDVGCSSGIITAELAPLLGKVLGGDFDLPALRHAPRGADKDLMFSQIDAMRLPIGDGAIDIVICAQVYEHVPDAEQLAAEIYRVLRPGGVVFFSGPNWTYPIEPHYFLPFLHWLPAPLAGGYLRLFGRGDSYYERSRSWWGLKKLWSRFKIRDLTLELVLHRPDDLTLDKRLAWVRALPVPLLRSLVPLMPNFNWVLQKPTEPWLGNDQSADIPG